MTNRTNDAVEPHNDHHDEHGGFLAIDRTSKENYLTTTSSLNLYDPMADFVADWHQSGWRRLVGEEVDRASHSSHRPAIQAWRSIWNDRHLFDCRPGLREIRHPAGWRTEPVWCASHVRAIIEEALVFVEFCLEGDEENPEIVMQCVPIDQINRWLMNDRQFLELQFYASKIGRRLEPGRRKRAWHRWHRTLHPHRRWDGDQEIWWPTFYEPDSPAVRDLSTPNTEQLQAIHDWRYGPQGKHGMGEYERGCLYPELEEILRSLQAKRTKGRRHPRTQLPRLARPEPPCEPRLYTGTQGFDPAQRERMQAWLEHHRLTVDERFAEIDRRERRKEMRRRVKSAVKAGVLWVLPRRFSA